MKITYLKDEELQVISGGIISNLVSKGGDCDRDDRRGKRFEDHDRDRDDRIAIPVLMV